VLIAKLIAPAGGNFKLGSYELPQKLSIFIIDMFDVVLAEITIQSFLAS